MVVTLDKDAAADAGDDRVGAHQAWAARIMRFATPVSENYLLAMMQAKFSRLHEFASSLLLGQLEWRQPARDSKVGSQER